VTRTEWKAIVASGRIPTMAECDAEVARIEALTDEELRAELIEDGEDPDVMVAEVELCFHKVLGGRVQ
jgi:hypothetical protein